MAHCTRSYSRGYSGVIRLGGRPTRALSLNYEIEKQRQAMCRDIKAIFSKGFMLAREQTFEPVEFLFILKEKSSSIFKYAGNGEMTARFENGEPLTTDKPRLKTKYQKDMTVVNVGDNLEVDLLTSHISEDVTSLAVGKRHTTAEGHKETLETLVIGPGTHNDVTPNSMLTMPIPVTQPKEDFKGQTSLLDQLEELEDEGLLETVDSLNPVVSGSYLNVATGEHPKNLPLKQDFIIYPVPGVKFEPLTGGQDFHSVNLTDDQMTSVKVAAEVEQKPDLGDAADPVSILQYGSCQFPGGYPTDIKIKLEISNVDSSTETYSKPDVQMPIISENLGLTRIDDQSQLSTKLEQPLSEDTQDTVEEEVLILGLGETTHCQSISLSDNESIDQHTAVSPGSPVKPGLGNVKPLQDLEVSSVDVRSSSLRTVSRQMRRQTAGRRLTHSLNPPTSKVLTDREKGTETAGNLYTFSRNSKKDNRKTSHAQKRTNYKCLVCNYRALEKYVMEQHVRTHTGEKPYMCHDCGYRSAAKTTMNDHIKIHSGIKPNKCSLCDMKFFRKSALTAHMRKHTGEKRFNCALCDYRCFRKWSITGHMRKHTGEKPYMCSVCQHRFAQKGQLVRHIRIHTGEKPYACSICNYRSANKGGLNSHMKRHSKEKPHGCSLCDQRFSCGGNLRKHVKRHHGPKPCHMGKDTGEKPYMCHLCQHRFGQKDTLVRHIRIHTGEKPYACSICNYRSADKRGLNSHMKRHSKEKPHGCSFCDQRFSCGGNLRKHVKRHHGPKP